jgi:ELWxxDGT repeat protein
MAGTRKVLQRTSIATIGMALALTATGAPAAAGGGIHLVVGEVRENGCETLEVWNDDTLVKVIEPDNLPDSGVPDACYPWPGSVDAYDSASWMATEQQLRAGSLLYFDWIHGYEYWVPGLSGGNERAGHLWATDGTPEGTVPLLGLHARHGKWGPYAGYHWLRAGSAVFVWQMRWDDQALGSRASIRMTRGSVASTRRLPVPSPQGIAAAGPRIFASGQDQAHGRELWVSDGTSKGTHLVMDIRSGAQSSRPRDLRSRDGLLWFSANDGMGRSQWVTDGTRKGTHKVAAP